MAKETLPKVEIKEGTAPAKVNGDGRIVSHEFLVDTIKKALAQLGPQHSKEEKVRLGKMLLDVLESGKTPLEAMGIPDKEIGPIYVVAYNLFVAGKYQEAMGHFKVLCSLDPTRVSFAMALGTCYHKLKDYMQAAILYLRAGSFDAVDPLPFYYAYDCFVNLKDYGSATVVLSEAIRRCGDVPKFQPMKEKAQLLIQRCRELLPPKGAPKQG